MKKTTNVIAAILSLAFIFFSLTVFAQDSLSYTPAGPIIPSDNIAGVPVPQWLQIVVIILATVLPLVQWILKRIPTAESVKIGGWIGKILDIVTFFQKDKAPGGSVHTTAISLFVVMAFMFAPNSTNAQSIWKSLPKIEHPAISRFTRATTPMPDSTFTGFRFAPAVLYALPESTLYTGIQIVYEHATYKQMTKKWYTNWAVGLGAYEGGQLSNSKQPINETTIVKTLSAATALGINVSFFNKLLVIGALYNITTHRGQGAAGPGVSLDN